MNTEVEMRERESAYPKGEEREYTIICNELLQDNVYPEQDSHIVISFCCIDEVHSSDPTAGPDVRVA